MITRAISLLEMRTKAREYGILYVSGLLGIMKDGDILEVEGDIVWPGCMECCKM